MHIQTSIIICKSIKCSHFNLNSYFITIMVYDIPLAKIQAYA